MKNHLFCTMLVVALALIPTILQCAWVGNGAPIPIPIPGGEKSGVEGLIIEGASSFLQSHSDIFLLLKESEMGLKSGFNFSQAQLATDSALAQLKISKENYTIVADVLKNAVYSKETLYQLKTFNYEGLATTRNLNPRIMKRVAEYLIRGDVGGIYQAYVNDMNVMQKNLEGIHENLARNQQPGMEVLRTLFQEYMDFMNFGYYTSLVFDNLKNSQ